jgi:predicted nucleic acid-binding protein
VTLVLDAAPLVTLADRRDPAQPAVEAILRDERGVLVIPAPVSAEVDYLIASRLGEHARHSYLDDLAAGRFIVECLEPDEYSTVAGLERAHAGLAPGLADLSIVVLASRFRTRRILTADERHFRALRPLQGGSFTLLPADA